MCCQSRSVGRGGGGGGKTQVEAAMGSLVEPIPNQRIPSALFVCSFQSALRPQVALPQAHSVKQSLRLLNTGAIAKLRHANQTDTQLIQSSVKGSLTFCLPVVWSSPNVAKSSVTECWAQERGLAFPPAGPSPTRSKAKLWGLLCPLIFFNLASSTCCTLRLNLATSQP